VIGALPVLRGTYGNLPCGKFVFVNVKKIALVGTFVCVFLLLLALIVGGIPARRPPKRPLAPGNTRAIEGTLAGVRVREVDTTHAAVVFLYDLDNRTDSDYRLTKGPDVVVMSG